MTGSESFITAMSGVGLGPLQSNCSTLIKAVAAGLEDVIKLLGVASKYPEHWAPSSSPVTNGPADDQGNLSLHWMAAMGQVDVAG